MEGLSHGTDERLERKKVCPHKCGKERNYCQYEREPILENFHKEGRTEVVQDSHVF